MTTFGSNDKSSLRQLAYMTASCTTSIGDAASTAVPNLQSDILSALQSLQKTLDMPSQDGIREQILGKTAACPDLFAFAAVP
jgi:hypothetical protein